MKRPALTETYMSEKQFKQHMIERGEQAIRDIKRSDGCQPLTREQMERIEAQRDALRRGR